jgi:hypothetical protein
MRINLAPLFFILLVISGFGIGAFLYVADPRLMIALLTVWLWTAIYGITYYQVKWTMRLFRRKRNP